MIARYGGSFLMRIERRHETNGTLDGCTFVGDDSEVAKISNSAGHEMFMACLKKPSYVVALVISLIVSHATAQSGGKFNAQDFKTRSVFELMVDDSTVLRVGASKIVTQSALVTLVHGLIPGNSDGLEIQFFTKPITEAGIADVLKNGAKELKKSDYAALVLFLDKDNRVWQANLSYVIPGTTVARTVAWKPEELKKFFSDYKFDGKRLRLKSNASYSDTESGKEKLRLSWNVDFDLPVFRSPR